MTFAALLPQEAHSVPGPTPLALPYLEDSRLNSSRFRAPGVAAVMAATAVVMAPNAATAQQPYRNIVNQRFRAVSNGPQSGIVVDVKDPKDAVGVQRAVDSKVRATLRAHTTLLEREIAILRQRHLLKPGHELPLVEVVHLRYNGRPVTTTRNAGRTRDVPATNDLKINIVTQGQYAFDPNSKTYHALNAFLNPANGQGLYQELKKILGSPFTNLPVNILNLDPDDAKTNISVRGVVVQFDQTNQVINIKFPTFSSDQDTFLGLAQSLTQAFYAPNNFGYDAYTQGIARAAACIAAQDFTANGFFAQLGSSIDPVDPVPSFYYTPYYDSTQSACARQQRVLSAHAKRPKCGRAGGHDRAAPANELDGVDKVLHRRPAVLHQVQQHVLRCGDGRCHRSE